jgi:phosphinothricin acetyltransferase
MAEARILAQNSPMAGSTPPLRSISPSARVRVRPAAARDCGAIAAIYDEAIRSGRATMDTEPAQAGAFAAQLARLSAREALLVAEGPRGVAGWGIVRHYSDRPGYAIACETSVYVSEAEQGRGAGSLLLEALVARASELGYRHLVAKIMAVNERSLSFHARHGFERVGRQRAIGRLNGVLHDVVILQRLLPDAPPLQD